MFFIFRINFGRTWYGTMVVGGLDSWKKLDPSLGNLLKCNILKTENFPSKVSHQTWRIYDLGFEFL